MSDCFFRFTAGPHTKSIFIQPINIAMRYRDFKYIVLTESRMEDYHFTSKNKKYVQQRSEMSAFVKSGKLKVQRTKDPKEGVILSIKNPTLVYKQLQNITKIIYTCNSLY